MNVRRETIIIFGHIPEDTDNHRNRPKQPQQSAPCRTQQLRLLQSPFHTCCEHKLPHIHTYWCGHNRTSYNQQAQTQNTMNGCGLNLEFWGLQ